MSFLRVSEPNVAAIPLDDLGITIAQNTSNFVMTDQFSIQDLYVSADLEAAIIAGDITVEIDYGTGFTAISAGDYTNRDALASFLNVYEITNENNNEDLVDGSEVNASGPASAPLHIHDARYFTETELGGTGGAGLIGVDSSLPWLNLSGANVQAVFDVIDNLFNTLITLDAAYDNDADGILDVDGTLKNLNLRSDNVNDVVISRTNLTNDQNFLLADVSANELILGAPVSGALAKVDVRVLTDLIVDGNITYTGTITDTTVNILNVTNANILLRDGAATGADAALEVERGSTGADANLRWNETTDRWMAGIIGTDFTIALLEVDETVTSVWEFQGGATTEPSMYLTEKAAAPTVNLGAAGQIPMSMMPGGILAVYDKSNGRNKWLSVDREQMIFTGRNNPNNANEYARLGAIPSNNGGNRLISAMTLVGISIQTAVAETWTAEVRKTDTVTVQSSLAAAAAIGNQSDAINVDFAAGDYIQVFINGTSVNRPIIKLEFARKF